VGCPRDIIEHCGCKGDPRKKAGAIMCKVLFRIWQIKENPKSASLEASQTVMAIHTKVQLNCLDFLDQSLPRGVWQTPKDGGREGCRLGLFMGNQAQGLWRSCFLHVNS